jgi:hypothetical protein
VEWRNTDAERRRELERFVADLEVVAGLLSGND